MKRLIRQLSLKEVPVWLQYFHCKLLEEAKTNWYESEHCWEWVVRLKATYEAMAAVNHNYRFYICHDIVPKFQPSNPLSLLVANIFFFPAIIYLSLA